MTAGEILGAIVLVTLHSGKVVDITDIELDGTILLTKEQLEELPAADIERCCREYHVMIYTQSISEMMEETDMQLEKMVLEYREPLELEEQQDGWHTCHEYSKCKRGSSSKPHKKAAYWHRVRSFCVRRNYH